MLSPSNVSPATPSREVQVLQELARYLDCLWRFSCCVSDATHEDHRSSSPSPFHSQVQPEVPFADFVLGVARRRGFSRAAIIAAFIYMGRFARASHRHPSALSVHRLFATCLLVAAKDFCHHPVTNADFGRSAGLEVSEVNRLEAIVVSRLEPGDLITISRNDYEGMIHNLTLTASQHLTGDICRHLAFALDLRPLRSPEESCDADDSVRRRAVVATNIESPAQRVAESPSAWWAAQSQQGSPSRQRGSPASLVSTERPRILDECGELLASGTFSDSPMMMIASLPSFAPSLLSAGESSSTTATAPPRHEPMQLAAPSALLPRP